MTKRGARLNLIRARIIGVDQTQNSILNLDVHHFGHKKISIFY